MNLDPVLSKLKLLLQTEQGPDTLTLVYESISSYKCTHVKSYLRARDNPTELFSSSNGHYHAFFVIMLDHFIVIALFS